MGFKEAGLRGSLRNVSVGASDIPDSAVFDDWADNKLINRDSFNTTPYQFTPLTDSGNTTDDRPEWSHQVKETGGLLEASEERLRYERTGDDPDGVVQVGTPDAGFDPETHDGVWFWTWNLGDAGNNNGFNAALADFATADHTARKADNTWNITCDPTESPEVKLKKRVNGTTTTVISGSPGLSLETDIDMRIEREPSTATWEVFVNGTSIGTDTDEFMPTVDGFLFSVNHDFIVRVDRLEVF